MSKSSLSNHEIIVLALYSIGGEATPVDTEDIAVKANALAPGRFAWRKYPEQINLEYVRVFLTDAKKAKNGALVLGSHRTGWTLSEAGLQFARLHASELGVTDLSREAVPKRELAWRLREKARIHAWVLELGAGDFDARQVSRQAAEELLRLDDYVVGYARQRVLARYRNAFLRDADIGPVVEAVTQAAGEGSEDE